MRSLLPSLDSESDANPLSRRRSARRRIALAWLWASLWAAVIWKLGGDEFSAPATNARLLEWLRWLVSDLDPISRYRLAIGLRKSAHFVEYAILALLTFRAALISAGRNRLASAASLSLFIVATLASADEARQAFSQVRAGSSYDVLLDIAGGAISIAGLILISRRMRPTDPTPSPENTEA